MLKLQTFRELINERLTTAALEIFGAVEKSFAEYEEELCRSKEESARLQRLLDVVTLPEVKLNREGFTDVQQFSLQESPLIKEEELWTNQEEEQLQGLQCDPTHSIFTSPSVKHHCDEEGFPELSHLDHSPTEGDLQPTNVTADCDGQVYGPPHPDCSDSPLVFVLAPDPSTNEVLPSRKKLFRCPVCSKSYTSSSSLQIHVRTHTGEDALRCPDCGKAFSKRSNLLVHMRRHTGEKPHQCLECGKAFSQRTSLRFHMRTHTGEKPHQCLECGKGFIQKQHLVDHLKRHSGDKPHRCLECGKAFVQLSGLRSHVRTHTQERPFRCRECGKEFSRLFHLRCHLDIHNREKQLRCKLLASGIH